MHPQSPVPCSVPFLPACQLFYISEYGSVKAAMAAAADDASWEDTTPGPVRVAPVARWVRGEAGL